MNKALISLCCLLFLSSLSAKVTRLSIMTEENFNFELNTVTKNLKLGDVIDIPEIPKNTKYLAHYIYLELENQKYPRRGMVGNTDSRLTVFFKNGQKQEFSLSKKKDGPLYIKKVDLKGENYTKKELDEIRIELRKGKAYLKKVKVFIKEQ